MTQVTSAPTCWQTSTLYSSNNSIDVTLSCSELHTQFTSGWMFLDLHRTARSALPYRVTLMQESHQKCSVSGGSSVYIGALNSSGLYRLPLPSKYKHGRRTLCYSQHRCQDPLGWSRVRILHHRRFQEAYVDSVAQVLDGIPRRC